MYISSFCHKMNYEFLENGIHKTQFKERMQYSKIQF